jgi:hypothetical protein
MLTEQQIQQALHAHRVVSLGIDDLHGPLGLEHLAETVARLVGTATAPSQRGRIERPLRLPQETWEKLDQLARAATQTGSAPVTASEVAAAILHQFVTTE